MAHFLMKRDRLDDAEVDRVVFPDPGDAADSLEHGGDVPVELKEDTLVKTRPVG